MKKRTSLFVLLGAAILFTSCLQQESMTTDRYTYDIEDRPRMAANSASVSYFSDHDMETNVGMADVIAQVEITSDQHIADFTLPSGYSYTACYYEAHVEELWYGQVMDEEIEIWFMDTGCILHKNDKMVVYVSYQEPDMYVPVDGEYSVFILNPPDDLVFPFGMDYAYTDIEGNGIQTLKDATDSVLAKIESGEEVVPEFLYGAVAEEYLPETAAE